MMGRAREIPALLLAFAWLVGVEALPLVHVATHASSSAHAHETDVHCHDGECHADEGAADSGHDASHGDGSVAHHSVALLAPPLPLIAIPGALIAEILPRAGVEEARADAWREDARARGPPATSDVRIAISS